MATILTYTADRGDMEIAQRAIQCREWIERMVRAQCKQQGLSSRIAAILARKLYKRISLYDKTARYLLLADCYIRPTQPLCIMHSGHPHDVEGIPAHCSSLDSVMYKYSQYYASIDVNSLLCSTVVNIFHGVVRKAR
jgi:hypothetical protein